MSWMVCKRYFFVLLFLYPWSYLPTNVSSLSDQNCLIIEFVSCPKVCTRCLFNHFFHSFQIKQSRKLLVRKPKLYSTKWYRKIYPFIHERYSFHKLHIAIQIIIRFLYLIKEKKWKLQISTCCFCYVYDLLPLFEI